MALVLILIIIASGCKQEENPASKEVVDKIEEANEPVSPKTKPFEKSSLSYLERHFMPKSKLYGKFFQDRIQFHIVDQPDLTLFKTSVAELTFYHIDSELAKKKFVMVADISSDLIEMHGSFKFKPLDSASTAIAKTKTVLEKRENRRVLNDQLGSFEMRWEKEDRTIRYRVSPDSIGKFAYELSEEIPDYQYLFQSVEYGISKADTIPSIESD